MKGELKWTMKEIAEVPPPLKTHARAREYATIVKAVLERGYRYTEIECKNIKGHVLRSGILRHIERHKLKGLRVVQRLNTAIIINETVKE